MDGWGVRRLLEKAGLASVLARKKGFGILVRQELESCEEGN